MPETLPDFLQSARALAEQHPIKRNGHTLMDTWQAFVRSVRADSPEIHYDSSLKLLSLGPVSPGCLACRRGGWDCYFVTSQCNLDCDFCISQNRRSDHFEGTNLGNQIGEVLSLYHRLGIDGLSFSGGEALLEQEKVFSLLRTCRADDQLQHIWLYTNGLLLDETLIRRLAESGLTELRFNTAASGYQHPHVMEMIQTAAQFFEWVTVEIPILPSDEGILLESLEEWDKIGVRALNLHELIFEPNSNSAQLPGERHPITLPDGHQTAISPASHRIAAHVFSQVSAKNLDLGVNYCATVGKWQQLTARRERLLPLSISANEAYLGEGLLESYYLLENGKVLPLAGEEGNALRRRRDGERLFHLKRMAPLSLQEKSKQWVFFEERP